MKTYLRFKNALSPGHRTGILHLIRPVCALMLAIVLFVTPVSAETVVLTLDEHTIPEALQCGEIWNEAGLDLTILPHPPACFVIELCDFISNPDNLALSPAILDVDLAGISGTVTSALALAASPCGDCAKVVFYDGSTVVDSAIGGAFPVDTIAVSALGMPVDRLVIEGCYSTAVYEIQIEYDPAPTGVTPITYAPRTPLESRPNPFSVMTRISFDTETGGRVQIRIYDVKGRMVRSLVDSEFPAGQRVVEWDGRDASGRRLATGVYFARLAVNGRIAAARKVVMAR